MATTFNWIYLGNSATVLDPTEGNNIAENAASFVGTTFGTAADPLAAHVTSVTTNDLGGTVGALDQNNTASNDTFTTNIGAGTQTYTFDASVIYNATVTYVDGSTATVTAVFVQDTAGNMYLAPEFALNADTTSYQAEPIRSITFNSLVSDEYSGLNPDRVVTGFEDGYIDGSAGSDLINAAYIEPSAGGQDRIDNNDAFLPGSTGNDDFVRAAAGNDTVLSGAGNDQIYGGTGNDSLDAGAGNDVLYGEDGTDSLFGGNGNDTLDGGAGADVVQGGAGDDSFRLTGGFGADAITGGETTETSGDIIDASAWTANATVVFTGNEGGTFSDGTSTATFTEIERFAFGSGNDTINASATTTGRNLDGGAGNDSITGGTGADTLAGGAGNDALFGGGGADQISGGDGNDTLNGGDGADGLTGGAGDDTFTLTGTFGADTITGGETGETTGDVIDASSFGTATTLTFTGNEAGTIANGGSTASFTEIERVTLGGGNDTVNASATTTGVNVDAGAGNDSLTGGSGADTLAVGAGNDALFGGAGADALSGGDGNDTLNGGDGADGLTGGAGDDTFTLTGTFGADTITGGETTETGGDVIDATGFGTATTLTFSGNEAGTIANGGSTASFTQVEQVRLGGGNDTVNAGSTTSGVNVDAGAGNDNLTGGSGADTLAGGTGADTINSGAGSDTISLGAGDGAADTLLLQGAFGNDSVSGFEMPTDNGDGTFTGHDQLDVSALTDANGNPVNPWDIVVTDTNGNGTGNAILTFPNGQSITLVGVTPAQVNQSGALHSMGVPCFTQGTHIRTRDGERRVEDLRVGDLVETADRGLQPILWIGKKRVAAIGNLAPVVFAKGVLGNHRALRVSPQHRMLMAGWQTEMFFGEEQVLVSAKHLVDGGQVAVVSGAEVEYFHILLDRHEILFAEGVPTESFHPGDQAYLTLDQAARDELYILFPELKHLGFAAYGSTARRCLKAHEAALLIAALRPEMALVA